MGGIYTTHDLALAAIARLQNQRGFREHPNLIDYDAEHPDFQGFSIDSYDVDQDYWPEGYDLPSE